MEVLLLGLGETAPHSYVIPKTTCCFAGVGSGDLFELRQPLVQPVPNLNKFSRSQPQPHSTFRVSCTNL